MEIGSVGKGFNQGVKKFYAHTVGVRTLVYLFFELNVIVVYTIRASSQKHLAFGFSKFLLLHYKLG
jgi:hypothetical protein